jgi:outer membrane protein TolC
MGFTLRATAGAVAVLVVCRQITHAAPGELRLADLVAVAVRQSPELAHARIDLDAARAALQRSEGIEDTVLGATATTLATHTPRTDPEGELIEVDSSVEVSVTKRFSTGTQIGLSAIGERLHLVGVQRTTTNGQPLEQGVQHRYFALPQLLFNQPLLRGAGRAGFEAPIAQAARQRDAAALNQEARARDLLVSLAQAYWQVAFSARQLEVRKASLDLAQQQLSYTEGAIRAEKVPRAEALAVRQAIAIRKQDVIAGEQEVYERSLALRQLARLEIGPDALAVTTEPLPTKIDAPSLEITQVVRDAFDHSPALAALVATRRAAEIGVAAADNAARPRLDLDAAAGPSGADKSPGTALRSGVDQPGYQINASLTFQQAIERSAERGGQAAARAAVATATVAEREGQARLAVRATRAVQRARAALASIALGDEAIDLAQQNIVAEQHRFELGKSTNFDVLRRQDELEQARLRQASAVADYLSARADLDGLSGAILGRYGIAMP